MSFKLDRLNVESVFVVMLSLPVFPDFFLFLWQYFPFSLISSFLRYSLYCNSPFHNFLFSSTLLFFCFSPHPDEQCQTAAPSPQPHSLPAAVRGAGKQPASRYPGCKRCLWWGQEEPFLRPLAGAGAAAGELHECRLSKCPVIWLRPQFPVQGEGWNADLVIKCSLTVCNTLFLQWQWFRISGPG